MEHSGWFQEILSGLSGFEMDPEPLQEDWGVEFFISRGGRRFWVGLSLWPGDEPEGAVTAWLAHFHHRSFWQKFSGAGKEEFRKLLGDFSARLANSPGVSSIAWYSEADLNGGAAEGKPTPI